MKRKQKIILLTITILLIIISLISYFAYQKHLIKQINNKYNQFIITNENIKVYKYINKKYQQIGKIYPKTALELDSLKEKNSKYFKIKDTNYYIYYQDINKKISTLAKETKENYLAFNSMVKIKKNTTILKESKKVIKLNENLSFPLLYKDDNYYYIEYLNQILSIAKNDAKIEEKENNLEEESSKISVLYYQTKPSDEIFKEEEKIFTDNNIYTISIEEYKAWLKGDIRLKKNATMLVSSDDNFKSDKYIINNLKDQGITLVNNNTVSEKNNNLNSISSYYITSETTKEYFEKAIKMETFTYPKKIVPTTTSKRNLEGNATSIPVLNYHFFYDSRLGESCNDGNCLDAVKFEEQLKYLKDNGFKTLTIEEFRKWLYNEIELPAKSVLLTIDDGAMGTGKHNGNKLIPLLEKYDSYATLFLITGWWARDNYNSKNLNVESHTNDMHTERVCQTESRGAKMLCSTYEEIVADLKTSIDINKSNEAFCYPFFVTNEKATKAVEDVGFKMAFVGGGSYATRNSNKFKIPRFQVRSTITLQQFINIVG